MSARSGVHPLDWSRARVFISCERLVPGTEQALSNWDDYQRVLVWRRWWVTERLCTKKKWSPASTTAAPCPKLPPGAHLPPNVWLSPASPACWSLGARSVHNHSLRLSLQVSPTGIEAGNPKTCVEEVTALVSWRSRTQGVSPEEWG